MEPTIKTEIPIARAMPRSDDMGDVPIVALVLNSASGAHEMSLHRDHLPQLHSFAPVSRVEMRVSFAIPEDDMALIAQFLSQGNYDDGEYPAHGPDDVVAMSEEEVSAELAARIEMDLSEAFEVDPEGLEDAWGGEEDGDDMDLDEAEDRGKDEAEEEEEEEEEGDGTSDISSSDDGDDDDDVNEEESDLNVTRDQEDGMATDYPTSLLTSLRMYKLAAAVGIPSLQLLARRRLYRSSVRHVTHPDFATVVDAVFSEPRTNSTEGREDTFSPMRDMLCTLVAWRCTCEDEFKRNIGQALMARHADLMEGVMVTIAREGGWGRSVERGLWDNSPAW